MRIGFAYTNRYGNCCSIGHADSNGYSNGSSVGHADINGSSVGYAYSDGDGDWCAVYPDTQTSSHRAAASIDYEADFKHSNGNSRGKLASSPLADGSHDL
jgi:hypothetical protein